MTPSSSWGRLVQQPPKPTTQRLESFVDVLELDE